MTARIVGFAAIAAIVAVFLVCRFRPPAKISMGNSGVMRTRMADFAVSKPQTRENKTEAETNWFLQNSVRPANAEVSGLPGVQVGATGVDERLEKPERVAAGDFVVAGFHAETDRWLRERPMEVEDIRQFVRVFNDVPLLRKKECIRRALNLIPDANVALLAGVLFDKSQPVEITREVFTDILNRPEEVKKPILQEIFKDKTHPCCSDAEWIFEVTGEKPK